MQTKGLWCVCSGKVIDVVKVLLKLNTLRNDIALVETEALCEHIFSKPDLAERVQKTFVEIICYTTSILDFTKHVAHTGPIYSLHMERVNYV